MAKINIMQRNTQIYYGNSALYPRIADFGPDFAELLLQNQRLWRQTQPWHLQYGRRLLWRDILPGKKGKRQFLGGS